MKRFYTDKWFWVAIILAVIVVYRAIAFSFAQPTGWAPPNSPPPSGQPAAPLDTSDANQEKDARLRVRELQARNTVGAGFEDGNNLRLDSRTGQIIFDRTRWGAEAKGAIRLGTDENDDWVLQATHNTLDADGWFTLGSGSGESPWAVVQGPTQRITYTGVVDVSGTVLADRVCLAKECRTDWSGVLGGGSGAFWQSEQSGRIHYDGRIGVGTEEQRLVSMLHVKAQSPAAPATQGLTIQGPQDTFQSQYAARLFMHGTDFRILRTTQDADDGLTIRANGDVVAGRGLQVKGDAVIGGTVAIGDIREIARSVDRALTVDDEGFVRLAKVLGAGGGDFCRPISLFYSVNEKQIPVSGQEQPIFIRYVESITQDAGERFIGNFCGGPTPEEVEDLERQYNNLRDRRDRFLETFDEAIRRQISETEQQPWNELIDFFREFEIRSPIRRRDE